MQNRRRVDFETPDLGKLPNFHPVDSIVHYCTKLETLYSCTMIQEDLNGFIYLVGLPMAPLWH